VLVQGGVLISFFFSVVLLLQVGGDGTTTLPQQLPKALQQALLQQAFDLAEYPELMAVLLRCAADVQQAQEQQLAQQQGEIAQQKDAIAQLRQQLGELQASMAAVLQQLPGHALPRTC
jgi:septal ring factor EnvC (AmiA/AmiB activator)